MPVETIIVMSPVAAKTVAAGLTSMKPALAAKLAGATKAGLAAKYSLIGQKVGGAGATLVTASKSSLAIPVAAKSGTLAAQLTASQPVATQEVAAKTTVVGAAALGSLLTQATTLVSQAQALATAISNNIVPLLGTAAAGVAGGVAGGGALQLQQNKKQEKIIDSLSTQTQAQQQAVENLKSELNATQEKVAQIATDRTEPETETVDPAPIDPPAVVEPDRLEDVKGIGPIFTQRLNEAGIYTLDQLAQLTPEQITEMMEKDDQSFSGDPEDWIKQARELAGIDD